MGLGNNEYGDDGGNSFGASSVPCSICLDMVADNADRSRAKLQCGHQFHLDCIGSAFNAKGAMQCPNCRKIEKGQWLYANGCRSFQEFSMDDWAHDEDLYDLSYSEMSFGVHWCPFGQLARLPSSFEEGEFSSSAYHDLLGQHAIFAEHTPVSSSSHPCPYIAYLGPIHPSSSNSSASVSDSSNSHNHWNGPSVPSEVASYGFPQHNSWEHQHQHQHQLHSSPFSTAGGRYGGVDQHSVPPVAQRSARPNSNIPGSGSSMHPFLSGHSSGGRPENSVASSMIPLYPGSNARARDRVQALEAYYQQQQPSNTRVISSSRRSNSQRQAGGPVGSSSDQNRGLYFFQEAGNRFQSPSFSMNQAERHMGWGAFHQVDESLRSRNLRQRQGSQSQRTSSHSQHHRS